MMVTHTERGGDACIARGGDLKFVEKTIDMPYLL